MFSPQHAPISALVTRHLQIIEASESETGWLSDRMEIGGNQ